MFVGHLSLGFAAKRADNSASLAWYIAAAAFVDLLWPLFLLLGIEHVSIVPGATAFTPLRFDSYPWSHSLLMTIVWGIVLAGIARWRGMSTKSAQLIAALVVSHWVLDFITHAPDMPLWPGQFSPRLGLGLWNSIPGSIAVEGLLWLVGLGLYLRSYRPQNWVGAIAFWSFVLISTVMWASGPWAAPPPNPRALAWFALMGWIIVPWAVWIDRSHVPRAQP